MVPLPGLAALIARQRGRLFLWVPICLSLGIGVYFALPQEPARIWLILAAAMAASGVVLVRRVGETAAPLVGVLALVLAGFAISGLRAHMVAEPVLSFRYYGPVEGRIVDIDRSMSDRMRLTLDEVVLSDTAPARTPAKVRVSLHGDHQGTEPRAGLLVAVTAHLSPPAGPVEPGGFDFQRLAWFEGLGAVGYARTPLVALAPPDMNGFTGAVFRLRMALSGAIRSRIDGQTGAFAAAILTGDRSGLSRDTLDEMRASNLAHLLAISGLHLGLLTGVVFAAVRGGIALIPRLALRVPAKKWAAVVALIAAAVYLALSGGNVATQRAFIMVSVMLCAVLLDRRALSLRAVALAAIIVLVLQPESLFGPGFQMSFAATTALVGVFGALRELRTDRLPRRLRPFLTLLLSSSIAGLATAPVGAAHFNQWASYGLLANTLSVPVMGLLIMPAAVAAGLLAPLGLSAIALLPMALGIDWILIVADRVAALDGAVRQIPAPHPVVLPMLMLGALWGGLCRGWVRWAGPVACLLALLIWTRSERPDLLIAETGALVGVMTEDGRALNKKRGDGFAAQNWLENDGDGALPEAAYARGRRFETAQGFTFPLGPLTIRQLGPAAARKATAPCAVVDLVVAGDALSDTGGCGIVLDPDALRLTGPVAISIDGQRVRLSAARARAGERLWNAAWVRDGRRAETPSPAQHAAALSDRLMAAARGDGSRPTAPPSAKLADGGSPRQ